jgi:hypothetical protein
MGRIAMRTAEVKRLEQKTGLLPMDELSGMMDLQQKIKIDTLNWKGYQYLPATEFAIAWSDNEIFLKYWVRESWLLAEKTEDNQNVYEDSCVEFFVSPENDGIYYNFEFNAIGTCLMGNGTGRADTKRVDTSVISKIRRLPSMGRNVVKESMGDFSWTLTVAIPLNVFFRHDIEDLKGKTFRANFYKCGDNLPEPHYVTWNPVGTEKPDFHRPEYFGELKFI